MISRMMVAFAASVPLAANGAAVAADPHVTPCAHYRHGTCVDGRRAATESRAIGVGYLFGPAYNYVDLTTLPQPIVTRYHLRPLYRYVNQGGFVYVVNPRSYRVVRVIAVR